MQIVFEAKHITKSFPGVIALDNIDFQLKKGDVHALLGENGAGKSTLVKIITGAYKKDSGELFINGKPVEFHSPIDARNAGIGSIYQEFSQVETLSVAENIFLGDYPYIHGIVDWKKLYSDTDELLSTFRVNASATDTLSDLGVATRQMVEILKVIRRQDLKILIMDEPTSALTSGEVSMLFDFIRTLKSQEVSIIYISHRLDEIGQICDSVTIFRNGQKVDTKKIGTVTIDEIVTMMVGAELKDHYPPKPQKSGEISLQIEKLNGHGFFDISFYARKGEVLGITGLVGAGKSELLETIFGAYPVSSGEIKIDGKTVSFTSPRQAIAQGIGLIPENRQEQGLILILSNLFNISLASLKKIASPFLSLKKETEIGKEMITQLQVRPSHPQLIAGNLSGGNQQKIVLSKWLMRDSDILFFDEPTRGIDVGAKFQIYSLITRLAEEGKTIIVASSEIEEIAGICNRALIMKDGSIVDELQGSNLKKETILSCMNGVERDEI